MLTICTQNMLMAVFVYVAPSPGLHTLYLVVVSLLSPLLEQILSLSLSFLTFFKKQIIYVVELCDLGLSAVLWFHL